MELIIGSHVSYDSDTQLLGSVKEALEYNANTFMFYTGNQANTMRFKIDENITKEAHELMKKNGIDKEKVIVHAPYIINLANNTDARKYNFYISFLKQELNRCKELGINNLVLHPGSYVSLTKEEAINNVIYGINKALGEIDDVNILLEFMSGKGSEVGSNIDELKQIIDGIEKSDQIYVCLDSCHMNDSGINLNEFDKFLDEFDSKIGINKIRCIHINDSSNEVGVKKDRHANIGYGHIGFDTLINVIYNQRLDGVPKILETPYYSLDKIKYLSPYKQEIDMIRNKRFTDFIQ